MPLGGGPPNILSKPAVSSLLKGGAGFPNGGPVGIPDGGPDAGGGAGLPLGGGPPNILSKPATSSLLTSRVALAPPKLGSSFLAAGTNVDVSMFFNCSDTFSPFHGVAKVSGTALGFSIFGGASVLAKPAAAAGLGSSGAAAVCGLGKLGAGA